MVWGVCQDVALAATGYCMAPVKAAFDALSIVEAILSGGVDGPVQADKGAGQDCGCQVAGAPAAARVMETVLLGGDCTVPFRAMTL